MHMRKPIDPVQLTTIIVTLTARPSAPDPV